MSFEILHRVALVSTDASEEHVAFFFRVTRHLDLFAVRTVTMKTMCGSERHYRGWGNKMYHRF
jgi:hypothetical protein